jgi:hypothetical protein
MNPQVAIPSTAFGYLVFVSLSMDSSRDTLSERPPDNPLRGMIDVVARTRFGGT